MATDAQQVMLAERWEPDTHDVKGWWLSEKLDGCRAYWSGSAFYTRLGNRLAAPAWFTKGLPATPLDGELWCGHRQFRKCMSIVRRHDESDEWRFITYFVFDAPRQPGAFEARMEHVNAVVGPGKTPYAVPVGMRKCTGRDHVMAQLKVVEDAGGEGLMLRKPRSEYIHGRTDILLKVKTFVDEEAVVIGHGKGTGRNAHRMGHLVCRTPDGREFSVGSGFTDKERDRPPKIGSVITYKYQELTEKSNKPRFPTFVGARLDIDWKDYCKDYKSPVDALPAMPSIKTKHSILFGTYGDPSQLGHAAPAAGSAAPVAAAPSAAAGKRKAADDDNDGAPAAPKPTADDDGDDSDDRPPCKYGASCYRKIKAHLDEFYHPPEPEPAAPSAPTSPAKSPAAKRARVDEVEKGPATQKDDDGGDDELDKTIVMDAAPVGPLVLQRVQSANVVAGEDEDDEDLMLALALSASAPAPAPSPLRPKPKPAAAAAPAALPVCRFGATCYRKNPAHFREFSHAGPAPSDADTGVAADD